MSKETNRYDKWFLILVIGMIVFESLIEPAFFNSFYKKILLQLSQDGTPFELFWDRYNFIHKFYLCYGWTIILAKSVINCVITFLLSLVFFNRALAVKEDWAKALALIAIGAYSISSVYAPVKSAIKVFRWDRTQSKIEFFTHSNGNVRIQYFIMKAAQREQDLKFLNQIGSVFQEVNYQGPFAREVMDILANEKSLSLTSKPEIKQVR